MTAKSQKRPAALWLLMFLLFFQGISAFPAGLMLALDPTGGLLQMPQEMLADTPFPNYLVPGLILCIVLGLGAFFVLLCLFTLPEWSWAERLNPFKQQHWTWAAALAFGIALVIWITVQVSLIGLGSVLQPLYFGVGLAILLLALVPSVRSYLHSQKEVPWSSYLRQS